MIGTGHLPHPISTPSRDPFVVMAKPVGPACNLACGYCYYLDSARLYERPHRFRMSDAMLERYVRQFIEASPGPLVHFVWHGASRPWPVSASTGEPSRDRHGLTRVIDKALLAGVVLLAHDDVEVPLPEPIAVAELAVLVSVRVALLVFELQQLQRHARTAQLTVHRREVRQRPGHARWPDRSEQALREGTVVHSVRQRPRQPREASTLHVPPHRDAGQPEGGLRPAAG